MFKRLRTFGFLFKETEFGETDLIFSFFTLDFGRLDLLAKGARKISSKLRPQTSLFSISEIEFVEGRFQKRLIGAKIQKRFQNLTENLRKLSVAFKISQVLDWLIKEGEKEERIFKLINEIFSKLNLLTFKKEGLLFCYFFWNLISILGFFLELNYCVVCEKSFNLKYLNFSFGGTICQNCFKNVKIGEKVDKEILKLLNYFKEKDFYFLENVKIKKEKEKEILALSEKYLKFLAQKNENF